MCCSVLHCVAVCCITISHCHVSVVQRILFELTLSVLQCVDVCCSVLHCVAVCCITISHCHVFVVQHIRIKFSFSFFEGSFQSSNRQARRSLLTETKLVDLFALKRCKRALPALAESCGKRFGKCNCRWDWL